MSRSRISARVTRFWGRTRTLRLMRGTKRLSKQQRLITGAAGFLIEPQQTKRAVHVQGGVALDLPPWVFLVHAESILDHRALGGNGNARLVPAVVGFAERA